MVPTYESIRRHILFLATFQTFYICTYDIIRMAYYGFTAVLRIRIRITKDLPDPDQHGQMRIRIRLENVQVH